MAHEKRITWLGGLVAVVLAVGWFYVYVVRGGQIFTHKTRIAVLTKDSPFFNQVAEGINGAVAKYFPTGCELRFFYGKGTDKILYQTMIEEAFMDKPDLIIPIGVSFSQLCVATAQKRKLAIPIVFAGPGEPLELGLISSLNIRPEPVTGVSLSAINYLEPAKLLLACKPLLKNILIPYFPGASAGMLEKVAQDLQLFFAEYGVSATVLPIYVAGEAKEMIMPFISKVDTIMCLEGDTISEVNDLLTKLCNQYHVTLFAKDLECVQGGAALGFGVQASAIGEKVMEYASCILNGKKAPGALPVYFVDGIRKLALNKQGASLQGVIVDQRLLSLVDEVY
ncbi:MAG: putative tryptophan/tyrosine transport system substrate-binding protein [Candidatus Dependentiae bacterium]|nr:putative tryptophan/tyrosine transport system substrate-binding protein [Candidatus Dependentiae bacterium]